MPNIKISDCKRTDEHSLDSFLLIGRNIKGELVFLDYTSDAADAISLHRAYVKVTSEDNPVTLIVQGDS